jgi:lipopolysaccharide export LptBFGC system permease protein LptF
MITRELITPLAIGLFLFLVMLVGNTLYAILEQLLRERWPLTFVGRLLILNIPTAMQLALPVACALAPGLAWSRLTRDGETTALRAAGIPLIRQAAPVIALGCTCALMASTLTERIVPRTWAAQTNVEGWLAALPSTTIDRSLTFNVSPITLSWWKTRKLDRTAFKMEQVTVLDRGTDGTSRITIAPTAEYRNSTWVLKDASIHALDTSGRTIWDAHADRQLLALNADFQSGVITSGGEQLQNRSRTDIEAMLRFSNDPQRRRELETALQSKPAIPLICIGLALCGIPLAIRTRNQGPFAAVVGALALVATSQLCLFLLQTLSIRGVIPPIAITIVPASLLCLVGLFGIRRAE